VALNRFSKAKTCHAFHQARGRACLRHSDLFVRHKVHTNQKTLPMPNSLVIKGAQPNKFRLMCASHFDLTRILS
jgi:hypothetical protein